MKEISEYINEEKRGITKESKRFASLLKRLNKTRDEFAEKAKNNDAVYGDFDETYKSAISSLETVLEVMNTQLKQHKSRNK